MTMHPALSKSELAALIVVAGRLSPDVLAKASIAERAAVDLFRSGGLDMRGDRPFGEFLATENPWDKGLPGTVIAGPLWHAGPEADAPVRYTDGGRAVWRVLWGAAHFIRTHYDREMEAEIQMDGSKTYGRTLFKKIDAFDFADAFLPQIDD